MCRQGRLRAPATQGTTSFPKSFIDRTRLKSETHESEDNQNGFVSGCLHGIASNLCAWCSVVIGVEHCSTELHSTVLHADLLITLEHNFSCT